MKKMIAIALTVTLLAIAGFFAIISFPTVGPDALADGPEVTITPPAGPPGMNVTIEGTGFPPGADYGWAIIFYGNVVAGGSVTSDWIEVDAQGEFSVQGQIPWEASEGVHGIVVFFNPDNPGVYLSGNPSQVEVQGMFYVASHPLTVAPDGIPFGTIVTLSGGNFGPPAAGGTPQLWINYKRVYLEAIDSQVLSGSGNLAPAAFEVSKDMNLHYGENIVQIIASVGGNEFSAATTLEVCRPILEIDPDRGTRGMTVTATGSGWLTGLTDFVTIEYERADNNDKATVAVTRPNQDGDIWAQFKVPGFAMTDEEISLLIGARDAKDNESLKSVFRVKLPRIWAEPDAAAPGEEVTVVGRGFMPLTMVQEVSIGDVPIVSPCEVVLTSGTGSFRVTGIVPGIMPGGHVVKARVTQPEESPITAPFTVTSGTAGDLTIKEGFKNINSLYTTVWSFDSQNQQWQVYQPGLPPWVPIYDELIPGKGYWVKVTEDCTLTYGPSTWDLKAAWNLIGWSEGNWGPSGVGVEEAFQHIAGKYVTIWTFDADAQEWMVYDVTPGAPDDFATLNLNQGYWIEVTEDCTLNYRANTWELWAPWNLIGWRD